MLNSLLDFLPGSKTYIIGLLMVAVAIARGVFGVDVPFFQEGDSGQMIMEGLGLIFIRKGIADSSS